MKKYPIILLISILTLQCTSNSKQDIVRNVAQDIAEYPDGLVRSIPESEGVASVGILNYIEAVEEKKFELHSFMLLRHGKVVAEGWWNPYQPDIRHTMFSVSKTFASTAIGLAIAENLISLDDKVVSFFPEYEADYATKELTVKNLLTMTVGNEAYTDFRERDPNWVKSFFSVARNAETANKFVYNSYAAYMMSAIIQRVTGNTMLDFLKPRLFDPLNITNITSEQSPAGIHCGGWGMGVTTSDMAKLGQLYLQKGKWNGKQILPESWVEEASRGQINTDQSLSNTSDWAQGYGYQMWLCQHNAYRADGAFGQFIIVMPEQDAVLAITAHIHDTQEELQQVWRHILPAISDNKLPEDKKTYAALVKKLNSLALAKPIDSTMKVETKNIFGTYTIANNELGIRSMELKQQGDSCKLVIRTNSASHNFTCGNSDWVYNTTDRNSPHFNDTIRNPINLSPYIVAGYYGWKDKQNMLLKLWYLEDGSSETFNISFSQKAISIGVKNIVEGHEAPPIQLIGYLN